MRWLIAAFLGSIVVTSVAQAEQTFPYKAYVASDEVYVRSGPGENYYPTDKLKEGQEVEIYRHDPGGWYAVRPPADSFSWVSGRYLQLDKDNLATVTEDGVAARVGSRFSNIRDVIQVRLQRGEVVEVLDAKRPDGLNAGPANTWYKIAPPSGEFRWVYGRFVASDYSPDGLQQTNRGSEASGSKRGARHFARSSATSLDDLDLELSTMVAEEPTVWDFTDLRDRVQARFDQAENAVERGRARTMLGKIARFEDIRQRTVALNAMSQQLARTDRRLSRLSSKSSSTSSDPDGRYDAVGRLNYVTASKPGAPRYAIMDDAGNVRCYVSPAPGVNLRSYVGQQVGINGMRGFMPENRTTHIMARHINPVDGNTLR